MSINNEYLTLEQFAKEVTALKRRYVEFMSDKAAIKDISEILKRFEKYMPQELSEFKPLIMIGLYETANALAYQHLIKVTLQALEQKDISVVSRRGFQISVLNMIGAYFGLPYKDTAKIEKLTEIKERITKELTADGFNIGEEIII